jgi:hypothetical protein
MSAGQLLTLFLAQGSFYHEDEGDTFLRNIGSHKTFTRHIPKDGILQSHGCENLKYYTEHMSIRTYRQTDINLYL